MDITTLSTFAGIMVAAIVIYKFVFRRDYERLNNRINKKADMVYVDNQVQIVRQHVEKNQEEINARLIALQASIDAIYKIISKK